MVKCIDRSNNEINWSKITSSTFDPAAIASGIYGVDNIIDVMFIGINDTAYSVSPAKFKSAYGDYNTGVRDRDWLPTRDRDEEEPIGFRHLQRSDMANLSSTTFNAGAGAWSRNASKLSTDANMPNIDGYLSGYNLSLANLVDPNVRAGTQATEFFILYNMMAQVSELVGQRGYKMFRPENLNHYQNWAGYTSASNRSYYNYLIVVYLTVPDLLQNLAFMRVADSIPPSLKSLSNIPNDSIINLVNDSCSSEFPASSILTEGTYYTGTVIYSADSETKFVVRPDGNCVVYRYDGSVLWHTDTSDIFFSLPKITVSSRGGVVVMGTRKSAQSKRIINDFRDSAFIHLDRSALVQRDYKYNIIRWTHIEPSTQSRYDNANVIKIYNTFVPNTNYPASANTIRYSPNMSHYLKFTSDGVLELHEAASTYPIRKDSVLWSTQEYTKGRPNAILSLTPNGYIMIHSDGKPLWSTGVESGTPCFLVADDNGYAIAYRHNGFKGSYEPPVWVNIVSERDYKTLYNKVAVAMQTNAIGTAPQSFTRACTDATYSKPRDKTAISLAQAKYCASGLNLVTDNRCSLFMSEDNRNDTTNTAFQNYIVPKVALLCSDGYDTRYPDDAAMQKRVNDFCSCKNPIGSSKNILGQGWNPICYDQICIDRGYKSIGTVNARQTCPSAICIQEVNLKNLQVASNIKVECKAEATKTNSGTNDVASSTSPASIPISFTEANIFKQGDYKSSSGTIVRPSPNAAYNLAFQGDGNLVLYTNKSPPKAVWASGTSNNPDALLSVAPDGNLTIYQKSDKSKPIWSTNTASANDHSMIASDNDGNVVVYHMTSKGWNSVWASIGIDRYTQNSLVTVAGYAIKQSNEPSNDVSPQEQSNTDNIGLIIGIVVAAIAILFITAIILVRKSRSIALITNLPAVVTPIAAPVVAPVVTPMTAPVVAPIAAPVVAAPVVAAPVVDAPVVAKSVV